MKVTFFERLGAYLIDMFIVNFIFLIICLGLGNSTSETEKLMQELDDKLVASEITPEQYLKEYKIVLYDYQKENIFQSGISLALTIAYYVIFQYMNQGQTIGKKILKLRVVRKDNEKPISILKGLLRSMIIYSILSSTILLGLLHLFNANKYFNAYTILLALEGLFMITTIMFVLYRKDGRGLHDIITNTLVIKENN